MLLPRLLWCLLLLWLLRLVLQVLLFFLLLLLLLMLLLLLPPLQLAPSISYSSFLFAAPSTTYTRQIKHRHQTEHAGSPRPCLACPP